MLARCLFSMKRMNYNRFSLQPEERHRKKKQQIEITKNRGRYVYNRQSKIINPKNEEESWFFNHKSSGLSGLGGGRVKKKNPCGG